MSPKGKHWLWLILFLPVFFLIRLKSRDPISAPVEEVSPPVVKTQPAAPPAIPAVARFGRSAPSYIPIRMARLQDYEPQGGCVLTGRVSNEQDAPLPGASVSLYSSSSKAKFPDYSWPAPMISSMCDADGRYIIVVKEPMQATVVVRMQDYSTKEEDIGFAGLGPIRRDYQLLPAPACIEGDVRDATGKPVPRAYLLGAPSDIESGKGQRFSLAAQQSDSSGRFVLRGLPVLPGVVLAFSEGYLPLSKKLAFQAGDCARAELILQKGMSFTFVVKNTRGIPIPNPSAMGSQAGGDEKGIITITMPPDSGPNQCQIRATGYQSKLVSIDPNAPPSEVVLEEAPTLKGRVVDDEGYPVAQANVRLFGESSVITDEAGRFLIYLSNPESPQRVISVKKPGYSDLLSLDPVKQWATESSLADPIPELEIRLERAGQGGFFGRVVDAEGSPVRRFAVSLAPKVGAGQTRSFENDDGLFAVRDIPAGTYHVTIYTTPASRTVEVKRVSLDSIEIRKGFFYGEIVAQFPPATEKKKP
jgi:hypothetical protein